MTEPTQEQIKGFWEWCGYVKAQQDMLKAGYVAVELLIEE